MKPKTCYYSVQHAPGYWQIIGPLGMPIYDDAHNGQDRIRIFNDEAEVERLVAQWNLELEELITKGEMQ